MILLSKLSIAESRLADLNKQCALQTNELQTITLSNSALSDAKARLETSLSQAEQNLLRLVQEKDSQSGELRRERDLRRTFETEGGVAKGRVEGLQEELTVARQRITELEAERKIASDGIASLTGQSKGLAKECEGLRQHLADLNSNSPCKQMNFGPSRRGTARFPM